MGNQSCFLQMFKGWTAEPKHPGGSVSDKKTYSAANGAPAGKWRPPQARQGQPEWHQAETCDSPCSGLSRSWEEVLSSRRKTGTPPGAKAWSPGLLTLGGDKERTWKSPGREDKVVFQTRTPEGKVRVGAGQSRAAPWGHIEKQSTQGRRKCSITSSGTFHLLYLLLYP